MRVGSERVRCAHSACIGNGSGRYHRAADQESATPVHRASCTRAASTSILVGASPLPCSGMDQPLKKLPTYRVAGQRRQRRACGPMYQPPHLIGSQPPMSPRMPHLCPNQRQRRGTSTRVSCSFMLLAPFWVGWHGVTEVESPSQLHRAPAVAPHLGPSSLGQPQRLLAGYSVLPGR